MPSVDIVPFHRTPPPSPRSTSLRNQFSISSAGGDGGSTSKSRYLLTVCNTGVISMAHLYDHTMDHVVLACEYVTEEGCAELIDVLRDECGITGNDNLTIVLMSPKDVMAATDLISAAEENDRWNMIILDSFLAGIGQKIIEPGIIGETTLQNVRSCLLSRGKEDRLHRLD